MVRTIIVTKLDYYLYHSNRWVKFNAIFLSQKEACHNTLILEFNTKKKKPNEDRLIFCRWFWYFHREVADEFWNLVPVMLWHRLSYSRLLFTARWGEDSLNFIAERYTEDGTKHLLRLQLSDSRKRNDAQQLSLLFLFQNWGALLVF